MSSWSMMVFHIHNFHQFFSPSTFCSPKTDQVMVSNPVSSIFMPGKYYCMLLRINIDCNACCRKLRRIILNMKEIESHLIEKKECSVCVCGVFRPSDVAIKIRKKMNRRVEILEIQDCDGAAEQTGEQNPGPAV